MKLHQIAVGNISRRVRKATQVGGPDVQFDEPEPGIEATESGPGELRRRTQAAPKRKSWSKLFNVGSITAPHISGVRKHTK